MKTQDKTSRTVLPIPDQPHVGLTTYDAKDPWDGQDSLDRKTGWFKV